MAKDPRRSPVPPDGTPAEPVQDRDATTRSTVGEVQDPAISGDGAKDLPRNSVDVPVDAGGNIRKDPDPVDLLH